MNIGEEKILTWNPAKECGDSLYSGDPVRVEACGVDWVVLRNRNGKALSATFKNKKERDQFWNECESYDD